MRKSGTSPFSVMYSEIGMARYLSWFAEGKKNYGEMVAAHKKTRMQYLRKNRLGKFAKNK